MLDAGHLHRVFEMVDEPAQRGAPDARDLFPVDLAQRRFPLFGVPRVLPSYGCSFGLEVLQFTIGADRNHHRGKHCSS